MNVEVRSDFDWRLPAFVFAWSFASVFHQFYSGLWVKSPIDAMTTIMSLVSMFTPHSLAIFLLFVAVHTSKILSHMPFVYTHEVLALIIDSTILLSALPFLTGWKRPHFVRDCFFAYFIPFGRCAVLILYSFTVLHKLNYVFLADTDQSCATTVFLRICQEFPFLFRLDNHLTRTAAAVFTVVSEASIMILLASRKWKWLGLLWGILFHLAILVTNPDFTVYMYATFILFFPKDLFLSRSPSSARVWRRSVLFASFGGAVLLTWLLGRLPHEFHREYKYSSLVIALLGWPLILLLAKEVRTKPVEQEKSILQPNGYFRAVQMVPLLLMIFLGLSPYLGFKTEGAFAMFSNLRTEGGVSNHIFMPRLRLFSYQDDLVEILKTSSPSLGKLSNGQFLVYKEFERSLRRALELEPDFKIDYRQGNSVISWNSARAHAKDLGDFNFVDQRLLWFRPIWPDGRCVH